MPQELIIEPQPSKKLGSDIVVYYVRNKNSKKLLCKFDSTVKTIAEIPNVTDLSIAQTFELENYLANVRFVIDRLNLSVKDNRAYRIRLPEFLQEALLEFSQKSKQHNIHFDPITAMLNGLLNHLSTTDKRLTGQGEPSLLNKLGIKAPDYKQDKISLEKENRKHTKKLFKHLMTIDDAFSTYKDIANEVYSKDTKLSLTTVESYSAGKTKPSAWSVSCAISVLARTNDTLLTKLPVKILIGLWLKPLRFLGKATSIDQAVILFKQYFNFEHELEQDAIKEIHSEMANPI
jgi:hypothetical protein